MQSSTGPPLLSKSGALRRLFDSPNAVVIVGAHDGLTARLVEQAGFEGVWASGFEISASHCVPDASILTMTEMLAAARVINKAVDIPIIADCDTGFGNAINTIRTVQEYEAAGIAGICLEDNVFPKHCSFYTDVHRALVDVGEHALKIKAAVEAARTPEFVIIARTEALVAGAGLEAALRRGRAYADAGAHAVVIHSKEATVNDVAEFASRWDRSVPLACIPTTYDSVSVAELASMGFKLIIFANQGLRASVRAVQEALGQLRSAGRASAIAGRISPLADIDRIVNVGLLKTQERDYLPSVDRNGEGDFQSEEGSD